MAGNRGEWRGGLFFPLPTGTPWQMSPRPIIVRTCNAFTLVELLVVMAVAGILASLLFSSLPPLTSSVRKSVCLANMRLVGLAGLNYAGDHNGNFPIQEDYAWDIPLSAYLDVTAPDHPISILRCPEDTRPLLISPGKFARSYCFNALLPQKVTGISRPDQTIMLAEWYTGQGGPPGGASENFQYGINYNTVAYSPGGIPSNNNMVGYHKTESNFIYADGHAKSVDPRKTVGAKSLWVVTID